MADDGTTARPPCTSQRAAQDSADLLADEEVGSPATWISQDSHGDHLLQPQRQRLLRCDGSAEHRTNIRQRHCRRCRSQTCGHYVRRILWKGPDNRQDHWQKDVLRVDPLRSCLSTGITAAWPPASSDDVHCG
jgi:hypothetical protein